MREAAANATPWDLRRHLEAPADTAHRSSALRPATLRLLADGITALCILLGAVLLPQLLRLPIDGAAGFGLLASLLFLTIASLTDEGALQARRPAGQRALLAGGVVLTVLLCWSLASPLHNGATALALAGAAWAMESAAACFLVNAIAARARARLPRIVLVGDGRQTALLAASLQHAATPLVALLAQLRDDLPADLALLGDLVGGGTVDCVVLAIPAQATERLAAVWDALADRPVRICLGLHAANPARRLAREVPVALVDLWHDPHSCAPRMIKRAIDILGSAALLAALSPLLLLCAALIRLESPGAALFVQWRFGLGSMPFRCFKFRTMDARRGDPTGEARTQRRDPRVTRIGRFLRRSSLDELPQLINVLRGEMSLVGPRPHPLHMRVAGDYYFDAVPDYRLRHRMRPGITGWAQVNGSRGEVATLAQARRRIELDIDYVRNWSLGHDIRILFRTLFRGFLTFSD